MGGVGAGLRDPLGVRLRLPVRLAVHVGVPDALRVPVALLEPVRDVDGDGVPVRLPVPVRLRELVPVWLPVPETLDEAVIVAVPVGGLVAEAVDEPVPAALGVALPDGLRSDARLRPRYVSRATTASLLPPAASHSSADSSTPLAMLLAGTSCEMFTYR